MLELEGMIRQVDGVGDGGVGEAAFDHVDALGEAGVILGGFLVGLIGDLEGIGECGVAEGDGAGSADGAGHVGDAVVEDAFDDIGGVFVGGGTAGFEAAALVDGNVDDDGAVFHIGQVLSGDEAWGFGAGDEYGADDEVGQAQLFADGVGVGVDGVDIGGHNVVEVSEAVEVDVHDDDVGAESCGDFGGVGADNAGAEDDDVGWCDAGDAAEEDAAAHGGFFEVFSAFLDGHFAGDFGHGCEAGEPAVAVVEGLVGDGDDLGVEAGFDQLGGGGEVEVGEDDLAGAEEADFGGLGFFDFDEEVGLLEDGFVGGEDGGADGAVLFVGEAGGGAGLGFEEDLVPGFDEQFDADGHHGDAVFVGLDFLGDADAHGFAP